MTPMDRRGRKALQWRALVLFEDGHRHGVWHDSYLMRTEQWT